MFFDAFFGDEGKKQVAQNVKSHVMFIEPTRDGMDHKLAI